MDNGGKSSVLSFAELMQCVGVHNFRHSWDSALDSYPLAAHFVLPAPIRKESDKVTFNAFACMSRFAAEFLIVAENRGLIPFTISYITKCKAQEFITTCFMITGINRSWCFYVCTRA